MARYDADGYRADGRKRISGYSREIQGGANEARARSDARREAQYTNRLPDRGVAGQIAAQPAMRQVSTGKQGIVVPSFGGGTKTIMPQAKATPREKLPEGIQRPAEQSVALEPGKRMIDKMVPPSSVASGLNDLMTSLGRKKRMSKVMRPTE